jgi:hypothetical protein
MPVPTTDPCHTRVFHSLSEEFSHQAIAPSCLVVLQLLQAGLNFAGCEGPVKLSCCSLSVPPHWAVGTGMRSSKPVRPVKGCDVAPWLSHTNGTPMAQPPTQLQLGQCPCCQSPHARDCVWVLQRWPLTMCSVSLRWVEKRIGLVDCVGVNGYDLGGVRLTDAVAEREDRARGTTGAHGHEACPRLLLHAVAWAAD